MASIPSAPKARPRPLSPHLQVWKLTLTMVMSGLHRITGMALCLGTLLLAWFLLALSGDATTFATFSWFIGSPIGQLMLLGWCWSLFHHLLGGVRHAIWDTGWGMDDPWREYLAGGTMVCSLALTLIVWIVSLFVR
jgi:succinate dehydrogenase / fumarate reductase cytochrome b subunit